MTERLGALTRDDATRRVMTTLALHSDLSMAVRDEEGSCPVVVALPADHISEVMQRVASIGGAASVAVAFTENFRMVNFGPLAAKKPAVIINQDLSMGMFLIKLDNNPGKALHFRFRNVDTEIPAANLEIQYA